MVSPKEFYGMICRNAFMILGLDITGYADPCFAYLDAFTTHHKCPFLWSCFGDAIFCFLQMVRDAHLSDCGIRKFCHLMYTIIHLPEDFLSSV